MANENHATLTINNAKWLWQEMQGTPAFYSCSYECAGTSLVPVISGPSLVCSQGTYTFTATNLPQGAGVNYFSGNLNALTIAPLSTDPTKANASRINNFNGNVTLTATVSGSCGSSPATPITIYVGAPSANISTQIYVAGQYGVNPVTLSPSATYLLMCDPVQGATSFNWVWPPHSFGSTGGSTSSSIYINTPPTVGSYYTINCAAVNACGQAWTNSLGVNINYGGGGSPAAAIAVYPNPTTSSLTLQIADSTSSEVQTLDQPYQVDMFNKFSENIYSIQSSKKKIDIPLDGLPGGIYYLNVSYKGTTLRRQIVVNK